MCGAAVLLLVATLANCLSCRPIMSFTAIGLEHCIANM